MKSIKNTLTLVTGIVNELQKSIKIDIALVGGLAVIAYGVGRTTIDIDFLVYSDYVLGGAFKFVELFKKAIPEQFELEFVEGSKMTDDPFPYDIIFLTDSQKEYRPMDFIIARYKWEVEGLLDARMLPDFSFPVLSIPYIIAMKLRAGGPKDHYDILELYNQLTDEEKEKTMNLAKLVKRDKSLLRLLERRQYSREDFFDKDSLI